MKKEITTGSLKQLWQILVPLSISMFSTFAMLFADRLFLSRYSPEALTAATSGGTLNWMMTGMFVSIASMSGIIVAQNNGARRYKELGKPIWQMIYFSAMSIIFFWIINQLVIKYAFNKQYLTEEQAEFLQYNYYYAPLCVCFTALTTFYIGQGKTKIVKWVGIIGNLVNIGLDYIFIFGIDGFIPSLGIKGAAIATTIGIAVQIFILGKDFLSKQNKKEFGTGNKLFDVNLFSFCIKKGTASALALFFELMGWSIYYILIRKTGAEQSLIASISQSIFLFFIFFGQAIEKSAASISGNLIGAEKFTEIKTLIKSGLKLSLTFGIIITIVLTFFSDLIINLFIINGDSTSYTQFDYYSIGRIKQKFHIIMPLLGLYIMTENFRWLATGVLISAGKNLYTMIINTASIWLLMILPTYFIVVLPKADIVYSFYIFIGHSVITFIIFILKILKLEELKITSRCSKEVL
jgi:MATE family multidrug resistance protein